jgi:hypothetical protein
MRGCDPGKDENALPRWDAQSGAPVVYILNLRGTDDHMRTQLVGVDCATDDARVGVARGWYDDGRLTLEQALVCSKEGPVTRHVAGWLADETATRTLLAIDAPLGWPTKLSQALMGHRAGQAIATEPNEMFRRATDRFIQRKLGKTPLDVGADRIARTAHAALRMLGELRQAFGAQIPLAWRPDFTTSPAAIEVYPAATLISLGCKAAGYKAPDQKVEREAIIERVRAVATVPADVSTLRENADALDAAICLLAAADFLRGAALPPDGNAPVEQEGWIWVCESYAERESPSNDGMQRTALRAATDAER